MSFLLNELRLTDSLETVSEIQFSIFSHNDIKQGSVCDILTQDTYDSNIPKNNGLFDHNMGSIDASIICPVDYHRPELCPGYFGKIDLALPVFNIHFVSYVEKLLKCVCFRCSNLLLDKNDPNVIKELEGKKGHNRFITCLALSSKNKKCCYNGGCFVLQPTKYIKLNGPANIKDKNNIIQIFAEFSQNALKDTKAIKQKNFTPLICYQIFKKIKDEDVNFLGFSSTFSRPEWMIITSLAVPPPSVRPSVRQSDNQRSEDDLTYALSNIVKSNKLLKQIMENSNSNNKKIDDYQGYLQYLIATYMDNEIPGVPQSAQRSSFRALKAITQRLKGKEGRLRGNIMGKRVDYSARTVISVDPNINIDEFGVPKKIAMNLTFPDIVTRFNIKEMKKYILNGPKKYPGAKTVTKTSDGKHLNIALKHVDVQNVADNLQIGDIVHRHLIDGDVCLFNRQPTLHRMSMMAHKIKILPYSTFRLNVTVCKPYNADFDGDEMNMHIPRSLQTCTELEEICLVPKHIISPGTSKPCIEITQDTLIGAYLLTINDIRMRRDQMNNYMMFSKKFNGLLPEPAGIENGLPYWNGKQLYSLILPDININQIKSIKIIRGQIMEGYLNSESLGGDPGGLIKQIYNAYGMQSCNDFLNDTQKLITRWMCDHSFSIGFGDCTITKDSRKMVNEITEKYLEEVYDVIKQAHHGVFANDLDDIYKSSNLEYAIMKILSNLTEKVKDYLVNNISKKNNFYQAGDKAAGSKGNTTNIQQIMGCVGEQSIWGARIEDGFTERTLPHFHRNDVSPAAKGFCKNSFIEGLTPSEMFFHAMGGRTGTIDTAIRTADSGYLSRKFIKAAEDLMINYDFTVRNATSHIVQFCYGDDHFDPIKLEKVTRIELIEFDNKKVEEVYKFNDIDNISYFETFMTPDAIAEMTIDDSYKNLLNEEYIQILENRHDLRYKYFAFVEAIGDINTFIPINLYRIIPSLLIKFNIEPHHLSDLTPKYIIENYNECIKDIIKYLPEKENNWILFKIIFKSFLSTKRLMKEYRMTKASFDNIILLIKEKMLNALIHPGEMIGIIGAQTLGEVSTQLTLNSVTYETEIMVRNSNGDIKKVQIGEFIENEIRKSGKIDYMADKNTTYAECAEFWEVQAPDEDGNIIWDRIDAVTKHPVINKDGTNTMLKITTEDEREVIATKAKSFLKLVNGKIIGVDGENLKVGDYLPISTKAVDYRETFTIDLKTVLPPTEYVYGSELEKAKSVMKEHHWWMKHANKTFILPHKRSDCVVRLVNYKLKKSNKDQILNGYVYMLLSNICDYMIPEVLELDYNFGYLVGAYAAEGCMTKHQISISNNDATYYEPIIELCNKWNLTTKIYKHENKNKEGWVSQDIRIYSTVLCDILEKFVGKLSHNKFIADEIIFSNKTCLKGFLDGYIGGDGSVSDSNITISSVSKKMLEHVMIILRVFDVFSHIHKPPKQETNNRGSLDIKQIYVLCIYGRQSRKLSYVLNMKIKHKQDGCELLKKHEHMFEYGKRFEMIPNEIDGEIVMEERNERFIDTLFSKIKTIEEVKNTTEYAYDLTVNLTKNFMISNFIDIRDTFHMAGVGSGSLVITEGVPRLREIINISKNLKNKNMLIYLNEIYSGNKDDARKIQSRFSYTQLKDILLKTEILYDNKYGMTEKKEDNEFIKSYKEFTELFDIDNIDESCLSPWILRLTFDKESLMNRKITIQEVQQTIKENSHNDDEIDCIYSDDSVNHVIMRIRIKQDTKGNFMDFMKDFEKELVELPLRGIVGIQQVECSELNIMKYNNDGSYQATKEWVLKTSGSNLLDILSHDAVDMSRSLTNDIIEFHEVFGIEATRELIYKELFKIYSKINPKHVQLLADIMTYRGKLMQIDRHGLNKNSEIGPIAKASFEEVMNIFTKAAIFAEKDNMKGVSANILAGQFCKSGTNSFDILIDEDKLLQKLDFDDNDQLKEFVNTNETDVDKAFDNAYSAYEPTESVEDADFNFGFGIEQKNEYLLNTIETKNVIIENKKLSKSSNNINEVDFNSVPIEEVSETTQLNNNEPLNFDSVPIEDIETEEDETAYNIPIENVYEDSGLNIDFDTIPIENAIVDEPVKTKTSTKKIRVKKVVSQPEFNETDDNKEVKVKKTLSKKKTGK